MSTASFPGLVSVVVATYDRAEYLHICLAVLLEQDYPDPWGIVIADDGSTDHTEAIIANARKRSRGIELAHCWHEHRGYRKAFNLNEGVRRSRGDLIVFLDSDCIPALDLLSVYAACARKGTLYLGGVFRLSQAFTESVLSDCDGFRPDRFLVHASEAGHQQAGAARRVRKRYWQSKLYALLGLGKPRIWGGNWAVSRGAFEDVNGYDENYVGYGQEDSDVWNRLVRAGHRAVPLHRKARAYHLWHPANMEARREATGSGNNRPYYNRPNVETRCRNGLRKL